MEPQPGALLVATSQLVDPNFENAVVLLLDVDDTGALGVVLNQPTPVPVADVLEPWSDLVAEPDVLFRGGPVGLDGALAVAQLADSGDAGEAAGAAVGWRPMYDDIALVDLDSPTELLDGSLRSLRVFAGYAGWGAEQLADEVAEGSWYVVASRAEDLFREDVTGLRRDVLRRQPGELAWASTRPADPQLN